MAALDIVSSPTEWIGSGKDEDRIAKEAAAFWSTLSKEEDKRRLIGEHFSFMEDVWGNTTTAPIIATDFEHIRRSQSQGFAYQLCSKFIDTHKIARGSRSATTNTIDNELKIDAYGACDCEAAHLFSHAEKCHKAFGILAEACVGKKVDEDFDVTPEPPVADTVVAAMGPTPVAAAAREREGKRKRKAPVRYSDLGPAQKRVKKHKTKQQIALDRLKLLNGVSGKKGTSLIGHRYNKMYFDKQGKYYDTENPSILAIPLLSFDEIMDWGKEGKQVPYDVLTITFGTKRKRASKLLALALDECSIGEIGRAKDVLTTFVKGVAASLLNEDIEENFEEQDYVSNPSLTTWSKLVERIQDKSQTTIGVPGPLEGEEQVQFHVAKSRLSQGNSLPDPWLVMIKAAINYSSFRNTKLMPACLPESDDGEMNTTQGKELYVKDSVDHATELVLSIQRGGDRIEIFSAE